MMDITDRIEEEKQKTLILNKTIEKKEISKILIDITFALSTKTDFEEILDTILEQVEIIVGMKHMQIL
jgi:transcriptional regulator with GAF, ATPase, and Fis domain